MGQTRLTNPSRPLSCEPEPEPEGAAPAAGACLAMSAVKPAGLAPAICKGDIVSTRGTVEWAARRRERD